MAKVIAVSGWKRSGKDTVANYLVKERGYKRFAFADVLKDMVAEQYGIPRTHLDDSKYKEAPILSMPVTPSDQFTTMIADFLKGEFKDATGQSYSVSPTWSSNMMYWTPRALAILEGSVKRSASSDYWVKRVINEIQEDDGKLLSMNRECLAVISDMRYTSEIDQLRKEFGDDLITVRLQRFDTNPSSDPSETDLDNANFDIVIENKDITLKELYALVEERI